MKKLFVLLVMTTILASGCIKAVMRVNPDGSGTFEIGMNMSVQSLQQASMMSGETDTEDLDEIVALLNAEEPMVDEETGIAISAEERLQNGSIWTYIIMSVPDIDAWEHVEEAGKRLFPEEDSEDAGNPADPSNIIAIPTVTVDGSTVRVELTVPSQFDAEAMEDDPFGMAAAMGAIIQMSYEIEMPGTLGEHNGQIDSLTGNPVWLINPLSPEDLEIMVESTAG